MANKWAESEGSVGGVGAPLGTGVRGRVVRRRCELCEGGREGGRGGREGGRKGGRGVLG